ncbi:unnamed protein product [Protopolystoma xenopodis]|uniref:Uncharacterized protein n=1 Tax=Protopolystoma xenopodis TaxID=117903 RepID=A0A3S5FDG6_9PLAT|nr:unnamed protein product [Protopolystoma xenopodis]
MAGLLLPSTNFIRKPPEPLLLRLHGIPTSPHSLHPLSPGKSPAFSNSNPAEMAAALVADHQRQEQQVRLLQANDVPGDGERGVWQRLAASSLASEVSGAFSLWEEPLFDFMFLTSEGTVSSVSSSGFENWRVGCLFTFKMTGHFFYIVVEELNA